VVDGQQFGHHGPLAELDQVSGSVWCFPRCTGSYLISELCNLAFVGEKTNTAWLLNKFDCKKINYCINNLICMNWLSCENI
jgi:hypothetical protein